MKRIACILLALGLLGGCVGCVPGYGRAAPETSAATGSAPQYAGAEGRFAGQTLKIAVFEGGYGPEYWQLMVQSFEDAYGVTVEVQISPSIGEIIMPQMIAGDVPDFLSIGYGNASGLIPRLIRERALLDITNFFEMETLDSGVAIKDIVMDGLMESTMLAPYGDGHLYLAPFNAGPAALVYNKTLFENNGWSIPKTFEDFFALGDEAAKQGIALFTLPSSAPGYIGNMLLPNIANVAGLEALEAIYAYEEGAFEHPGVRQVLEQYAHLGAGGYLLEGTLNMNHTQTQNELLQNNVLFMPNGIWVANEMADTPRSEGFTWGMAPAMVLNEEEPQYVLSSLEEFSIPAHAQNPALAMEFMRFLYTEESVRQFARHAGGVYALKGAVELVKDEVPEDVYNMLQVYGDGPLLIGGWHAVPAGVDLNPSREFYFYINHVLAGRRSVDDWVAHMEAVTAEIRAAQQAAE